jgi:hypothetical protein
MNKYRVLINNGFYKISILVIFTTTVIAGLFRVIFAKKFFLFPYIFLPIIVILPILLKWKYQGIIIKIYAVLIALSGISGIISSLSNFGTDQISQMQRSLPLYSIIISIVCLGYGLYLFIRFKNNSTEIESK